MAQRNLLMDNEKASQQSKPSFFLTENPHEAMPAHFNAGIMLLLFQYLGGDVIYYWLGDGETKPFSSEKRKHFTLFGKTADELVNPEASELGNLILDGSEEKARAAVKIAKEKPHLLRCLAESSDRLERRVKGVTPYQMTRMAGDVGLKVGDRGLMELLEEAGNLTDQEIARQSEVTNSPEALAATASRNQRTQTLVELFGNKILHEKKEIEGKMDIQNYNNFQAFQARCVPHFQEYQAALMEMRKEVITLGLISDPAKLKNALEFLEKHIDAFGGWWSIAADVFVVNAFGTLQKESSSRDGHVIHAGIANLVDHGQVPPRTLSNPDGTSDFNSDSGLGGLFFKGIYRSISWQASVWPAPAGCPFGKLMSSKNNSLMRRQEAGTVPRMKCLIM